MWIKKKRSSIKNDRGMNRVMVIVLLNSLEFSVLRYLITKRNCYISIIYKLE